MSAAASSTCSVCSNTSRWWNGLCSTPRIAAGLGQDDVEHAEPVEQADAVVGMVGRRAGAASRCRSARRGPVGQVGVAAGQPLGLRVDRRTRARARSGRGAAAAAGRRRRPARRRPAVGPPRGRRGRRTGRAARRPSSGIAIALIGEVALGPGRRRSPRGCAVMSTVRPSRTTRHAPCALGERERRPRRSRGRAAGGGRRVAGRPPGRRRSPARPSSRVADATADEATPRRRGASARTASSTSATTCSTRRGRGASDVTIS